MEHPNLITILKYSKFFSPFRIDNSDAADILPNFAALVYQLVQITQLSNNTNKISRHNMLYSIFFDPIIDP